MLRYYCRCKHKIHNQAKHLATIQNPTMRRYLTNFRISSHNLSIEYGRYTVPPTPLHERKCTLCNCNQIEEEPHFLISCPRYTDIRQHMRVCVCFQWDMVHWVRILTISIQHSQPSVCNVLSFKTSSYMLSMNMLLFLSMSLNSE